MAKLVFAMNVSLDGYIDHMKLGPPAPVAFSHFLQQLRGMAGLLYGRRMYEIMRYWDDDRPEWDAMDRDFAAAWRSKPKWVMSRASKSVGPNATLIEGDLENAVHALKARHSGEIQVGGPGLAQSVTDLGLIDEYQLYFRPVVLGEGKPYFVGPRPPLRLKTSERIEDIMKLTYVPA
jgi:dihydrofolate reductase